MKRVIAAAGLCLLLGACSVGMAISGKENPDLSVVKEGASRGEVELQLGSPIKTALLEDGAKADVYEYEIGNEPSTGRAIGHGVLDVLTLGLWEVVGTPIEGVQGNKFRLTVYYDKNDKVTSIKSRKVETETAETDPEEKAEGNGDDDKVAAAPLAAGSTPTNAAKPEPVSNSVASPANDSTTQPASVAPVAVAAAKPAPPVRKAANSPYRIQLASARSRAEAEDEWAKLQAIWPEIFGSQDPIIIEKNIAGRGMFYRVQAGGFDTLREARSVCASLHSEKQPCFALKRL